jgi:hypothetical protein
MSVTVPHFYSGKPDIYDRVPCTETAIADPVAEVESGEEACRRPAGEPSQDD